MEWRMARRIDEIVESLSEPDRVLVAEKMAELDRKLEQRRTFDAAIVDSLTRILESPNPQAKRLRQLIKEIAK
jgi:hypothetical protein